MKKNIFIFSIFLVLGLVILLSWYYLIPEDDTAPAKPDQNISQENTQDKVKTYIEENISDLSPEKEVLGGSFMVTNLDFMSDDKVKIWYEDGHIALIALAGYKINNGEVKIENFTIINNDEEVEPPLGSETQTDTKCLPEQRNVAACIEIYQPVCANLQVECVTTPCDPIKQTFSNSCKACQNSRVISYTEGECIE